MSGTPRALTLDGFSFNWAADVDITEEVEVETEGIPTSGVATFKVTKKLGNRSGEVICSDSDWEELQNIAKKTENFSMSYENMYGTIYRAEGRINIDSRMTAENRASITMIPADGWTPFL